MEKNHIVLPRRMVAVLGDEQNIRQLNLYFQNMVTGYIGDRIIDVQCDYGRQYAGFWRLEPGNGAVSRYQAGAGCFDLRVTVRDYDFQVIDEAVTTVEVLENVPKEKCHVLCIGDSITRGGFYIEHMQEIMPWIVSMGTRTYDQGLSNKEGRGGWSCKSFLHENALEHPWEYAFQSPFMFPAGISGSQFWGSTAFWQNVMWKDPKGYDFDGFQKMAAGWGEVTGPYLFDENGYPKSPKPGDVVFDPNEPRGHNFLSWDSGAWTAMPTQPAWELSFAKYVERFRQAFVRDGTDHVPDVVSIMFGPNDIPSLDALDGFIESLERLVASVKAYDRDMPVILHLPTCGSNLDLPNKPAPYYRRLMQEGGRRILQRWDNDQALADRIHVCGTLLAMDPVYGYGTREEAAFSYTEEKIRMPGDPLHPTPQGHRQMGDLLAWLIQKIW